MKKAADRTTAGTSEGNPPVLARLPQELIDHIDACAEANCRSRSAEIRFRLEASIEGESIDEHGVIVQRTPSARK
ncbi:MAG: Arc family DNA-binding protein [Hylemonella sp.]